MLLIVFAIPVVVFFSVFSKYYTSYQQNEFNQSFIASSLKSKSDFNLISNNCDNFYTTVMKDDNTLKFLNQLNPEPTNIDKYALFTTVLKQYQQFTASNPYIDSVMLYNVKNDYVLSTKASNYRDKFLQKDIIDKIIDNKKCRTFVSQITADGKKENIITVAYDICLNYYDRADGILIININCNSLSDNISTGYIYEDVFLISQNGDILNSYSDIFQKELNKFRNIYLNHKDEISSSSYFLQKAKNGTLCYVPIKQFNINMALYMPSKNSNKLVVSSIITLAAFIAVMMLVILIVSLYTSLNIYKNIANIISVIGISPIPGKGQTNEIKFIADSFLTVLKNNSDVEKELTDKIQLLRKSQTLALQTQINPHFIFNTLNLVNLMIIRIAKGNCAPAQIITLLSDIIYYSLNTDKFITTLDEELTYAGKYIQIEQIKYNGKFDFEFNVPEELKKYKTVKFTLQPILENCIEHGIKKLKDKKGTIKLKAYENNGLLKIVISDNGMGISYEKLCEINKRLSSDDIPTGKHIGLSNVNQRIQLIFGKEYGIKINKPNEGVQIEITHPVSL